MPLDGGSIPRPHQFTKALRRAFGVSRVRIENSAIDKFASSAIWPVMVDHEEVRQFFFFKTGNIGSHSVL